MLLLPINGQKRVATTKKPPKKQRLKGERQMWQNDFETETLTPRLLAIYEPIETTAGKDCEPYCCYTSTVVFYEHPWRGLNKVDEVETQWNLLGERFTDELEGLAGVAPFVEHNGAIYELVNGHVVWQKGSWFMEWVARLVNDDDVRLQFVKEKDK